MAEGKASKGEARYTGGMMSSIAGMMIAMISVQSGASLAKLLFPLFGSGGTAAMRIIFAALLLALLFRPWKARLTRNNWQPILFYGATLAAMNISFYAAIARIPLGIAVAIEFVGPLSVAIASSRKPTDFLWIALAVAGLTLLTPWSPESANLDRLGLLLALCAGMCWALYIIFGKWAGQHHGPRAASLGMIVAAIFALPVGIAEVGTALFDPQLLALATAVALLSSAIPYALEMVALRHLPAATFGILLSLEPALGAIAGYVVLHEALNLTQWTAIVAIMAASAGAAVTAATHSPRIRDAP